MLFGVRILVNTLVNACAKVLKIQKPIFFSVVKMPKNNGLTDKIIGLLDEDPGQSVKEMAEQLEVNRTFLSGYLKALEDQGFIKSKKIGPAKVYFNESKVKRGTNCGKK